jgi:two-component system, cell cycle response regulator DivK
MTNLTKKILIVEDDIANLELVTEVLSSISVEFEVATTGKETLDYFKSGNKADLVLMDIRLPDYDGCDLTKEIVKQHPDLPIVAVTAYAFEKDRVKCLESGCIDYLAKPYAIGDLIKVISKYLVVAIPVILSN